MPDFDEIDMSNINKEDLLIYEPIPAGVYELAAKNWDSKTSKNNAQYLSVQYRVLGPTHENWVIWENFAIGAKNSAIAEMRLYSWALAAGYDVDKFNPRTMDQLIHKPFKAMVGIKRSREFGDRNKILNFTPLKKSEIPEDNDTDRRPDYYEVF